ncbi:MAG: sulfite exporter TauE/SafE family protein [Ruminococcus sp.]|nr:sulfite exporter TauE/SafE family protein [Ruminococcus sp.]
MKKKFSKLKLLICGIIIGSLTGFFGSGGGILAVPLLESAGLEPQNAHSTSIAITLPLSIISSFFYLSGGSLDISEALKYLPLGIIGAVVGAKLLSRISGKLLKKVFAVVMVIAGVRLIWI